MSYLSFICILNAFKQDSSKYETVRTSKICVLFNLLWTYLYTVWFVFHSPSLLSDNNLARFFILWQEKFIKSRWTLCLAITEGKENKTATEHLIFSGNWMKWLPEKQHNNTTVCIQIMSTGLAWPFHFIADLTLGNRGLWHFWRKL